MEDAKGKVTKGNVRKSDYITANVALPLVELEYGSYILNEWLDIGLVKPSPAGGFIPLDAQDVYFHCLNSGLDWKPWERKLIVSMSKAYCAEVQTAKSPFCIAPIDREGAPTP